MAIVNLRHLTLVLACWFFTGCTAVENHFVYQPDVYPDGWQQIDADHIEESWIETEDGERLHGLFARHPDPRACILFAHGRSGNVTTPIEHLKKFVQRHQVSVLIFDYRGYGRSTGKPDEAGLYADARAARRWLAQTADIAESEIILMGKSLGAAVVVELAASDDARAIILESAFTSLPDVVEHHAPQVPAERILTNKFDSINKLSHYDGPVLICHGTEDNVIPFQHGWKLFTAASGPKHFIAMRGGTHLSGPTAKYNAALSQFIDDVQRQSDREQPLAQRTTSTDSF